MQTIVGVLLSRSHVAAKWGIALKILKYTIHKNLMAGDFDISNL